jgi:hypothetical protein
VLPLVQRGEDDMAKTPQGRKQLTRWITPLIFIPFIAVLWVPFYNQLEPELFGIPYFYWYQLAWIFVSAALTIVAYLIGER